MAKDVTKSYLRGAGTFLATALDEFDHGIQGSLPIVVNNLQTHRALE